MECGQPVEVISQILVQLVPSVPSGGVAALILGLGHVPSRGAHSPLRAPVPLLILGGLPDAVSLLLLP